MACFLVPATEAVVTTAVTHIISKKEKQETSGCNDSEVSADEGGISLSGKMKWLNNMLWGGSALLCFEHIWHGEVTPFFPFLTAASEGNAVQMLQEMGTVGVSMAALVTLVWAGMVAVSGIIEKRTPKNIQTAVRREER